MQMHRGDAMNERDGVFVIGSDAAFKGSVKNCQRLDVLGYVEGTVDTRELVVHDGGNFYGQAKAKAATVSGTMQGDAVVEGLFKIHSTGVVAGNIHYGRLALDAGAHLSADVRNVPPRLMGDFAITVVRGRSVRLTTEDITAIDPDNTTSELIFAVSNAQHGHVSVTGGPASAAAAFSQADLMAGRVLFRHDGSATESARFDVQVTDTSGATSGAPQTVTVTVRASA
jgi:cytoskeletal protein CcmA (bactofilin family)